MDDTTAAIAAAHRLGVAHVVVRHGPVASLEEAAAVRGVSAADIIKTMVVRRGENDYLFVLVPGDRVIAWPKLRETLGAHRLSMPDAATALSVTGYERGTITPFGASHQWPVVADESIVGRRVSIGGGDHGVSMTMEGSDAIAALGAAVADITEPA